MSKRIRTDAKTLCRVRGLFHDLIVTKKGKQITLWSDAGVRHTVFDADAPHIPGLEYARNVLAVLAFCPEARSCLILGLGGGSIPRMLLAALSEIAVDAVEIDPAVVELAARYFEIDTLPRLTVHLEDGAEFLSHCRRQYDIIVIDAYAGGHFPARCASREFLEQARKCLAADGVLVINWLEGGAEMQRTLLTNIEKTIGPVWRLPGVRSRNVLYFATPRQVTRPELAASAAAAERRLPSGIPLTRLVSRFRT